MVGALIQPTSLHETAPFCMRPTLLKLLVAVFLGSSTSVFGLDFEVNEATGVITASGRVDFNDADAIAQIITTEFKQRHRQIRDGGTLNMNSPGGSLIGGIRLGYVLRELFVHTNVQAEHSCSSACALAFLGGNHRTVEGKLGFHAAGFNLDAVHVQQTDLLDAIQKLGAITTAYVQEMTGSNAVAIRALSTSNASLSVLSDDELVHMRAITMARRQSQFGKPGFKCPASNNFSILNIVCVNLDIALLDVELNELYEKIVKNSARDVIVNLAQEQKVWRSYRSSCVNDSRPNGMRSIIHCVREAYAVRRDQLLSKWLFISAGKTGPGETNWKPLTPLD